MTTSPDPASAPAGAGAAARRRRARLALVPAALLVAVAAWELVAVARLDADQPGDDDWAAAAAAVRAGHQPGDLIVFAPEWIDPLGRRWLGDLIPLDMAGRMDAARYGVVWEVAQGGARAAEVADQAPGQTWSFGPLRVRRYQRPAAEVVTDFVARFAGAEQGGATASPAQVSLEEVGFRPHRCIKVVPKPGGSGVVVFRGVTLGRELVGYVGLADVFTRREVRAPGRLHVAVDGDEVAAVEVGVDDGWVRFAVPTAPGPATVVFQATAVGAGARDRRICFAAEARR